MRVGVFARRRRSTRGGYLHRGALRLAATMGDADAGVPFAGAAWSPPPPPAADGRSSCLSQVQQAVVETMHARHEKGLGARDLASPYELHSTLPDFVLDVAVKRGGETYTVFAQEQEAERRCSAYVALLKEYLFALEDRLAYSLRHEKNLEEAYVAMHIHNQELSEANAALEQNTQAVHDLERRCRHLLHENRQLQDDNNSYKAHLQTRQHDIDELLRRHKDMEQQLQSVTADADDTIARAKEQFDAQWHDLQLANAGGDAQFRETMTRFLQDLRVAQIARFDTEKRIVRRDRALLEQRRQMEWMHTALREAQEREMKLREELLHTRRQLASSTRNGAELRNALQVGQAALSVCEQENEQLKGR